MKLEASTRLGARNVDGEPALELKVFCSDPDTLATFINLCGVIQFNGAVGHSATVGAFFDGDGSGQISFEGLPDGDYTEMAQALCSYGDDFMAHIGPNSAAAFNTVYPETLTDEHRVVKQTNIWPEQVTAASKFVRFEKDTILKTIERLKQHVADMESQKGNPTVTPNYNKLLGKIEALEAIASGDAYQLPLL